jgi:hypothetical protein
LRVAVTPVGAPVTASVIGAVKFVRAMFSVVVWLPPWATVSDVGESEKAYDDAGAAVTVSVNVAVTDETPEPLAVTVIGYVPVAVVAATLTVTVIVVVLPEVCTFDGAPVTPVGTPVIAMVGTPVKPLAPVTVAVTAVDPPCATLALVGLKARVMLGVGDVLSDLSPPHAPSSPTPMARPSADQRRAERKLRVM